MTEDTEYVMDPESSCHNLIAAKDWITGKTIVFTHGREAVCMETGGERAYYRTDEKRSVEAIRNEQGGIKAEIRYGDFGETENPEALTTGGNPFGYTGYAYEESTGLYDAKARHYDAENGRFVSRDSYEGVINRASSGNRYTYAENNPVRYVDPDGHLPLAAAIAATEVVLLVVAMMATVKIIEMAYEDFQTKKGREALRNADKVIFRGEQYTPKQFEKQAASPEEMILEGGKKIGKALWDAINAVLNPVGKEKLKKVTLESSEGKGQANSVAVGVSGNTITVGDKRYVCNTVAEEVAQSMKRSRHKYYPAKLIGDEVLVAPIEISRGEALAIMSLNKWDVGVFAVEKKYAKKSM